MKSNMTIDMMDDPSALRRMFEIQSEALALLPDAFPAIAEAAKHVARVIGEGGRLIYCGAGSSGLIAVQDGAELPGTFGIDPAQIVFLWPAVLIRPIISWVMSKMMKPPLFVK